MSNYYMEVTHADGRAMAMDDLVTLEKIRTKARALMCETVAAEFYNRDYMREEFQKGMADVWDDTFAVLDREIKEALASK